MHKLTEQYPTDVLIAEINAIIEGREFTNLTTVAAGWAAWSHYATQGEW